MAASKAKLPTPAEIRAQIAQAEERVTQASGRFAQAAFEKIGNPEMETGPPRAELEDAEAEVGSLQAALVIAEQVEAESLEETRAGLAEEQSRNLNKALQELLKQAMAYSAHQQNAASAWRRMIKAGGECSRLLFEPQRRSGHFPSQLCALGLRNLAELEINRIGLLPAFEPGVSAPGARRDTVPLNFAAVPQTLPSLEEEIRRLAAVIMQTAPEPRQGAVVSEETADLPNVAEKLQPTHTASADDLAAGRTEEAA